MLSSAGLQIAAGGFFDSRDKTNIEALRERNEERRRRFLNSRQRTMGMDVETLKRQEAEKRQKAEEERKFDESYHAHEARVASLMREREVEEANARAEEAARLRGAWEAQEDRTVRPEWDLNDPDALKKDLPGRVGDDDPRCGPSSMQMFSGEDLAAKRRREEQARQQREWCERGLAERREAALRERDEERAYAAHTQRLGEMMRAAEETEASERAARLLEMRDTNAALQRERAERERAEARAEAEAARRETESRLQDPILMEDTRMAVSDGAPGRRNRTEFYKGMAAEEVAAIRAEQARQREELAERRRKEREEEMAYAAHEREVAEAVRRAEAEEANRKAEERARLAAEHREQARQARMRAKRRDEELDQKVDDSYFRQWGRSCR